MRYSSGFEESEIAIPSYSSSKTSKLPRSEEKVTTPIIPISNELFVRNIPVDAERAEVEKLFQPFGNCFVKLSRNAAFVVFDSPAAAEAAMKKLDNSFYQKQVLSIQYGKQRNTTSSCLICGLVGHWAKSCPSNKDQLLDVKSGKCFKCGEAGHLAKFCRQAESPLPEIPRYHRERDSGGYDHVERANYRDYPRSRPTYHYAERVRSPRHEQPRYDRYDRYPTDRYPADRHPTDRYAPPLDHYSHYDRHDYDYRKYPSDNYRPRDRHAYDPMDYRLADYHDYRR